MVNTTKESIDPSALVAIEGLGLGVFGIDRFYAGQIWLGILKLISLGGLGIWALVDYVIVMIHTISRSSGALFGRTIKGDRNFARNFAVALIIMSIVSSIIIAVVKKFR